MYIHICQHNKQHRNNIKNKNLQSAQQAKQFQNLTAKNPIEMSTKKTQILSRKQIQIQAAAKTKNHTLTSQFMC